MLAKAWEWAVKHTKIGSTMPNLKFKTRYIDIPGVNLKGHPFVGVAYPFESKSEPGKIHNVHVTEQGLTCECIGFARHSNCWHSKKVAGKIR